MTRNTALMFAMALVVAAFGCQWKGGPSAAPRSSSARGIWQPQPVAMRVYPSSRFVQQGEQALLEARIELLDEMNDSIKAGGDFRFELYPAEMAGGGTAGSDRLYAWDVELHTPDDQRRHYDTITRAYLFRLKLDDLGIAARGVRLAATFATPEGQRLSAEINLATRE